MGAEHCPRCDRPYTAGEVTGLSVLKSRPAALGGPWLEFSCPGCRFLLRLLPHGNGRYSIPGEPVPPEPSPNERAVPWRRSGAGDTPGRSRLPADAGPAGEPPAPRATRDDPPPPPRPPRPPQIPRRPATNGVPAMDAPLTRAEAREILGVLESDGIDLVEEAFRKRALLCHPDKVAHLDADFQALASAKFRRLQSARDLLVG